MRILTPWEVTKLRAMGGVGVLRGSGIPLRYVALDCVCADFRRHEMTASDPRLRPATIGPRPTAPQLKPDTFDEQKTESYLALHHRANSSFDLRGIVH